MLQSFLSFYVCLFFWTLALKEFMCGVLWGLFVSSLDLYFLIFIINIFPSLNYFNVTPSLPLSCLYLAIWFYLFIILIFTFFFCSQLFSPKAMLLYYLWIGDWALVKDKQSFGFWSTLIKWQEFPKNRENVQVIVALNYISLFVIGNKLFMMLGFTFLHNKL